jgi:hypothetical protein
MGVRNAPHATLAQPASRQLRRGVAKDIFRRARRATLDTTGALARGVRINLKGPGLRENAGGRLTQYTISVLWLYRGGDGPPQEVGDLR